MKKTLKIAIIATECFPFVKVGGLADVIGSLPRALADLGAEVRIILPGFQRGDSSGMREACPPLDVDSGGGKRVRIESTRLPGSTVNLLVIEDGHYFPRAGMYLDPQTGADYPDQALRWLFFQEAALTLLARDWPEVDVIHCHEHQTALIPLLLEHRYRPRGLFPHVSTVLTIHNLGYQGIFPGDTVSGEDLPKDLHAPGGPLEFYGKVNFMKGGILAADALTVVSPTYAEEIQTAEYGYGLDGVIRERGADLFGILNGIDQTEWNPETDARIPAMFGAGNLSRRRLNRRGLIEAFGLGECSDSVPVLAMVSRIDRHKGFDLVIPLLDRLVETNVRFLLVGTGDPTIEAGLGNFADRYPQRVAVRFAFDETLAHLVMAGADIFLMPSRYEPCGLTQMYALRYGSVPVVRQTGGLADTVQEFDPEGGRGNGFLFRDYDVDEFGRAIGRAIDCWKEPIWSVVMKNGMSADFSWRASAARYLEVYRHAIGKHSGGN